MKKIFLLSLFCIVLIFSSVVAISRPQNVGATSHCGNWRVATTPTPVTPGTKTINVSIQTFGLVTGDTYAVIFRDARINPADITNPDFQNQTRDAEVARVPVGSDGRITINNLNVYGETNNPNPIDIFGGGNYSLEVRDPAGNPQCTVGFTVQRTPLQQQCVVNFTNTRFSPNDDIMVNVSPIEGRHRVKLERAEGGRRSTNCYDASGGSLSANLGRAEVGTWRVVVMNSCVDGESLEINQCVSQNFRITPDGSGGGPSDSRTPIAPTRLSDGCGKNEIRTAIGCIPYGDANSFVGWFLEWAIGIAGGIAFLMIIFSGFQIMTSSNNPQQLQTGRELLTAAVSGLILIIFSAFLLKLIGVDILGIPGLGSP